MNFPGPCISALAERVHRLHRHNLRRGFHSAKVLVNTAEFDKVAEEFRFAPLGLMLYGLPVEINGQVPSVAVTRGPRVAFAS